MFYVKKKWKRVLHYYTNSLVILDFKENKLQKEQNIFLERIFYNSNH